MPNRVEPCSELDATLKRLDNYKNFLNSLRPLNPVIIEKLRQDLLVRMTYHSNAIEGNTLTMSETQVVLTHGITIGGKTILEHLEAINHKDALLWLLDHVSADRQFITLDDIKTIHSYVLANRPLEAGQWRSDDVFISGSRHNPPEFEKISYHMAEMMDWVEVESAKFHPVERAARYHVDLVTIHPFIDGNGRTARLLMNLELIRNGFPPTIIEVEERMEYYRCLEQSQTQGDFRDFLQFVGSAVERSFNIYWRLHRVTEEQTNALKS
jgi:Fic family protein